MSVLLVVDLQQGFISDSSVVDTISELVPQFDVVLASRFVGGNRLYSDELNWSPSSEGLQLSPIVRDVIDKTDIYDKSGYNALDNTNLRERIQNLNVEQVYLVGFETSACVLSTALSLFDLEITPIVIEPGCYSATESLHQSALQLLRYNIGEQNIIEDLSNLDLK